MGNPVSALEVKAVGAAVGFGVRPGVAVAVAAGVDVAGSVAVDPGEGEGRPDAAGTEVDAPGDPEVAGDVGDGPLRQPLSATATTARSARCRRGPR